MMRLLSILLFFPLVFPARAQVAGVGGWVTPEQVAELGASWFHQWNLCTVSGGAYSSPHECVSVVKNQAQYTAEQIMADMRLCGSGWIMFGDEWNVGAMTPTEQAEALRWFHSVAHAKTGNATCRIAFGGWLVGQGDDWLAVRDEYRRLYGRRLPVDAIVLDTYRWSEGWIDDMWDAVGSVRQAFPGLQVWAREVGCLTSHECALTAMQELDQVGSLFDRWAWFLSQDAPGGYWEFTALYRDGALTDLGEMFRDRCEP